jgi:hypothetical protein
MLRDARVPPRRAAASLLEVLPAAPLREQGRDDETTTAEWESARY